MLSMGRHHHHRGTNGPNAGISIWNFGIHELCIWLGAARGDDRDLQRSGGWAGSCSVRYLWDGLALRKIRYVHAVDDVRLIENAGLVSGPGWALRCMCAAQVLRIAFGDERRTCHVP
ncbi:hypothetical protein HBI56_216260 [Parastagonospora nodorum]|uniref:Uncharacterized protein n=1 Tax=Phaeosphaeria nodorum (strain SN15 / ATCC MYA-4574 / FGSC 10173) TaxID=321614 RepID=A0A7U2I1R5_PHANO|nr:hypothetical protein HBH56_176200 [Parastagonospora nodorum]QRC96207.1 hypothetical protein JI435_300720 [Parastagonospora nodorum SN15]KAH3926361.1 hypothetical protein HBH54_166960 [Parastagonospora nodorum]KAH3939152.1 hypothetical protein HBH53_239960 [Parastagonospora nodorum]KAH3965577.1 hypothetical protein HBH52_203600 [Parastagonospora nodorum]